MSLPLPKIEISLSQCISKQSIDDQHTDNLQVVYLHLPQSKSVQHHPTELNVWTRKRNEPKHVVLMIPGNPGIVDYYQDFLKSLYTSLPSSNLDIYCCQHLGHAAHPYTYHDPAIRPYYSLHDQVYQKLYIVDHLLHVYPKNTTFHLIGHSVGAWFVIQVLKYRHAFFSSLFNLGRVILLFPTIAHIRNSPNGYTIGYLGHWLPRFLAQTFLFVPLSKLPKSCSDFILSIVTKLPKHHHQITLHKLIDPDVVHHILCMTNDEMHEIKDLDDTVLDPFISKIVFYYGSSDGWVAPQRYNEVKSRWPHHDHIYLCQDNFEHAFVLHHAQPMGLRVGEWIKDAIESASL